MADTPLLDALADEHAVASAHEHLRGECPWYRAVSAGAPAADFKQYCKPATGSGAPPRLVVKLTPRTAEASTVPEPTRPPGGPGLFHIKGRELPPYIQHLWHHLVKEYGEHKAYGVAVGIMHKWKEGVNPGGWKRKGGAPARVHADVQAAATRAIAEWDKDRADAHKQSAEHARHHVRATAIELAGKTVPLDTPGGTDNFPGKAMVPLPPVPQEKTAAVMFTAHRVDDSLTSLTHAMERLHTAKRASGEMRGYHMIHVRNHLSKALQTNHMLVDNVQRNYPAEAAELDQLNQCLGLARAESRSAKVATFAHLLQTILYDCAHAKRHADAMAKGQSDSEFQFNWDHAHKHTASAYEHVLKLMDHLRDNYSAEWRWLQRLNGSTPPAAEVQLAASLAGADQYGLHQAPSQTVSPSPPLPPYVEAPSASEVRKVIGAVPDSQQEDLSRTVRQFLETAAVKLERDDELAALTMLRAAGTAIYAAHKGDLRDLMPAIYAAVPGPEQSSATSAMHEAGTRTEAWRRVEMDVQALADRIRKRYFHGVYNGPSQEARLAGGDMTALDRVLLAAAVTGKDVSFPTESDTSMATPLLQAKAAQVTLGPDGDAAKELASLTSLDRVRIDAYISAARECLDSAPSVAAQHLARAKVIAREAGANDLARHLHEQIQAIASGANNTASEAEAQSQPGNWDGTDKPYGSVTKLSAVDTLIALAKTAGTSAGKSAGTPGPANSKLTSTAAQHGTSTAKPDAHQWHEAHLAHLQHIHAEHLKHLQHVAHMLHG